MERKYKMLKKLKEIEWSYLRTAQGKKADFIPDLLLQLLSFNLEEIEESSSKLYNNIANQGTIYEASFYVIPFLNMVIKFGTDTSKIHAYDLLFEIVNGFPLYDDTVIFDNEELDLKEANYRLTFKSIDDYINDLEFITTNKELSNYILDLLSLFYKDAERKLVINKLNKIENSLFQNRINAVIKELSISQKETEKYNEKALKEYEEENKEVLLALRDREFPTRGVHEKDIIRIANNVKEILNYKIKEDGLGNIYWNMSQKEFINKYVSYPLVDEEIIKIRYTDKGKTTHYKFFNSVEIGIDVDNGVRSIFLENNFQGKYQKSIGIGTSYSEIKKIISKEGLESKRRNYLHYDDNILLIGRGYDFQVIFNTEENEKLSGLELIDIIMNFDEDFNNIKVESIFFKEN